jgi:hypothetical protein
MKFETLNSLFVFKHILSGPPMEDRIADLGIECWTAPRGQAQTWKGANS